MPWSLYFPLSIGKICTQNREILAGLSPGDFPLLTLSFAKLVQPCFRLCLPRTDAGFTAPSTLASGADCSPLTPSCLSTQKQSLLASLQGSIMSFPPKLYYCLCPLKRAQTDSFGQTLFQILAQPPSTYGRSQNPAAQNHSSLVWKKDVSVCQSCQTLCDPMDCSPPGSSVHGISQARILEWVAISFSRGSSWPRDRSHVFALSGGFFTIEPPGKPLGSRACVVLVNTPLPCSEPDVSWAGCFPPLPTPGPAQLQQCPLPFHVLPSISVWSEFGELLPSGLSGSLGGSGLKMPGGPNGACGVKHTASPTD